MATSTVANNKIKVHELNGKPLPPGWVLDQRGRPVTDPKAALQIIYDKKGGGGQRGDIDRTVLPQFAPHRPVHAPTGGDDRRRGYLRFEGRPRHSV